MTLRARCGAPDHEVVLPVIRSRRSGGEEVWSREDVEHWTYRGAPGDLMRVVRLEQGVVAGIETLGERPVDDAPCAWDGISAGDRLGEVLVRCGEPAHVAVREELTRVGSKATTTTAPGALTANHRLKTVHTLTYDPGAGAFLRVYRFENGVLVKVRRAERSPSR